MERGLYHLYLLGISPCVLLTPLFRWNRRSARRMMVPLPKGCAGPAVNDPSPPLWIWGASFISWARSVLPIWCVANLVRFGLLGYRNLFLGKKGLLRISTYPGCARFKIGEGPLGEVRFAAETTVGIPGRREPSRHLRWKQPLRLHCEKGHWKPREASSTSAVTC